MSVGSFQLVGTSTPLKRTAIVVETKPAWLGTWGQNRRLIAKRSEISTASVGGWQADLERLYGPQVMDVRAGDTTPSDVARENLLGHWVRILGLFPSLRRGQEPTTLWVGRIVEEKREVGGDDVSGKTGGVQRFRAYGPDDILRRTAVAGSVWQTLVTRTFRLDIVPDFNIRDPAGLVLGNRSDAKVDSPTGGRTYVFGGSSLWTHADILDYLLQWFVAHKESNVIVSPQWGVQGQVEILRDHVSFMRVGDSATVHSLLERLIPAEQAVDYVIRYNVLAGGAGETFVIDIHSLTPQSHAFGGFVIRKNPRSVRLRLDSAKIDRIDVERSITERYDVFRAVGGHVVTCLSAGHLAQTRMSPLWSAGKELIYKGITAAPGANEPDLEVQAIRATDHFRDVYLTFTFSNVFDFQGGKANPRIDPATGTVTIEDTSQQPPKPWPWQDWIRRTKPSLPLRELTDYTVDPPIPTGLVNLELGQLPPFVVAVDPKSGKHIVAERLSEVIRTGANIAMIDNEWGAHLLAGPNHAFARNHWDGPQTTPDGFDPQESGVDYAKLTFTVAVRTDNRLAAEVEVGRNMRSGLNLTKVIDVPDAEFWWLAPETIVGVEPKDVAGDPGHDPPIPPRVQGELMKSPNKGIELRNDWNKLIRFAGGALARFLASRTMVSVTLREIGVWHRQLGAILEAIESDGSTIVDQVATPITSVVLDFEQGHTTLNAGGADR